MSTYRPEGELAAAIDEHFGSFEAFSKQLSNATATVQGSRWGILAWEPLSGRGQLDRRDDPLRDGPGQISRLTPREVRRRSRSPAYGQMPREVVDDLACVVLDAVDEGGLAPPQHG
ncbi:MAG: Fe-Mn family superoxide dismutase [Actinoallomurus sp.]